jgi:hypothetical protein
MPFEYGYTVNPLLFLRYLSLEECIQRIQLGKAPQVDTGIAMLSTPIPIKRIHCIVTSTPSKEYWFGGLIESQLRSFAIIKSRLVDTNLPSGNPLCTVISS